MLTDRTIHTGHRNISVRNRGGEFDVWQASVGGLGRAASNSEIWGGTT